MFPQKIINVGFPIESNRNWSINCYDIYHFFSKLTTRPLGFTRQKLVVRIYMWKLILCQVKKRAFSRYFSWHIIYRFIYVLVCSLHERSHIVFLFKRKRQYKQLVFRRPHHIADNVFITKRIDIRFRSKA